MRKTKFQRVASFLLALTLLLGCSVVAVSAQEDPGVINSTVTEKTIDARTNLFFLKLSIETVIRCDHERKKKCAFSARSIERPTILIATIDAGVRTLERNVVQLLTAKWTIFIPIKERISYMKVRNPRTELMNLFFRAYVLTLSAGEETALSIAVNSFSCIGAHLISFMLSVTKW
jgi:hypothetical protein